MRPLILGEAPSKSGDAFWRFPLSGVVGQRLCEWAGLEPEAGGTRYGRYYWPLREAFELRNLLERYPGAQGRGAALPIELARPAWRELLPSLDGRRVVLLGSRLRDLRGGQTYYDWVSYADGKMITAIPHPSGLNRMYNAAEHVERASVVLHEALVL